MAFYLSPLVAVQEVDLTTTVPAVATSIAAIVLRKTYKGPEKKQILITDEDNLVATFGKPTDTSYKDLLAAEGYLKYGNKLYCTRVMPGDSTFGGTVATSGYGSVEGHYTAYSSGVELSDIPSEDPNDVSDSTVVTNYTDFDSPLAFIASSTGAWGNNIRVAVFDKDVYDALTGRSTTSATATAAANTWETDYNAATVAQRTSMTYGTITDIDAPLAATTDFLIVVQLQEQNEDDWETVEVWNVSTKENAIDDQGATRYVENVINEQSEYIRCVLASAFKNERMLTGVKYWQQFTLGSDGTWGANEEDSASITAYELYDNAEEIDVNIFIDGDKGITVKQELISICEDDRKDSMAVLDCLSTNVLNTSNQAEKLRKFRMGLDASNFNPNTSYASLYGNWLEVFDKYNNKYRWIPAAGHMAGLYARTDDVADPWWAPAGLNRTVLTNVRRLAWNPNRGERDILYKNGINPIVGFAGKGKVVWGQKTLLDKESAFNRVNVRRLFLVLEKAISTASVYFLFEPNDAYTRIQLRTMIEPFLRDVQARRGIYDYRVICDETNNTPERIDRNELWCDILIKPTRAAEFIVLRFVATKTGASFDEIANQLQG